MIKRVLVTAALVISYSTNNSIGAPQQLIPNGNFETIVLDDMSQPVLDEYGKKQATDWFRSGGGGTPPSGTPTTELITNDSNGTGTNSAAMNPVSGNHSDWRSPNFPTTPGEVLTFSFDFKFLNVVSFPEFQQFRIEVRSFSDESGSSFVGEQPLYVSPVAYELTGNPSVPSNFGDGMWHTLGFERTIPAGGLFTDVRMSINAFTTLIEGQVRIDNVSLTRPVVALPGDYNANGVVDAADYVVWRATLGSTTDLSANGDNTGPSMGVVDHADYVFWRANFGNGSGSGSGLATGTVPEPSSFFLLFSAAVAWPTRSAFFRSKS